MHTCAALQAEHSRHFERNAALRKVEDAAAALHGDVGARGNGRRRAPLQNEGPAQHLHRQHAKKESMPKAGGNGGAQSRCIAIKGQLPACAIRVSVNICVQCMIVLGDFSCHFLSLVRV